MSNKNYSFFSKLNICISLGYITYFNALSTKTSENVTFDI